MNKVITINLNGNAYQLEEDGYEALRAYLEAAGRRLQGNPDRDEIMADIEQSIADKFRTVLGANKTVVVSKEVQDVIEQMGPVQDDSGGSEEPKPGKASSSTGASAGAAAASPGPGTARKLYRIREGAQVAGVCNGLAAYLGIDVTILRIIFAVCVLTFGAGILVYIVMMFVIPPANTPEEVAAAHGVPATAEEFIRRAKEGYYGGVKAFGDRQAFKEWKWQFKRDMKQARRNMRDHAWKWRHDWNLGWSQTPPPHPTHYAFGSLLGIASFAISMLCLYAIISLIVTGAVFGTFSLPAGMPLWLGIILVILLFKLIKWPIRIMKYNLYYGGSPGPGAPGGFCCMWSSFGWLLLLALFIWIFDHHSLTFHEALHHFAHATNRAVDAVRQWWSEQ